MKNDMEMRFRFGGAIRALEGRRLEVLACPFGSPDDLDHLDEFMTARTDFMLDVGDRRPALYFHGFTPDKRMTARPFPIGVATASRSDDEGLWMEVELKEGHLADRVWKSAEEGRCRASTGAVNYLCRSSKQGEVLVWPIGELSLLDEGLGRHPVNDKAVAIPLRASFKALDIPVPEAFGEKAADWETLFEGLDLSDDEGETEMTPEEIQAAIRAALVEERKAILDEATAREELKKSIIEELKGDPEHRALFSVPKGETKKGLFLTEDQKKRGLTIEDLKETHEFVWNLRHGGTPEMRAGISYEPSGEGAMRVLEETEAAEGLAFVPQELDAQVQSLKTETSLVDQIGIFRRKSNRLIYNFIREDAGMGALAAIAEEGAYVANEPAFALAPVTVGKYGSMVTATEELLEDQNIFQTWFTGKVARMWALAENLHLFTIAKAGGMEGTHSDTITAAEVIAFPFTMPEEWVARAHWVMAAATMGAHRGLLIATPRAFGDFPTFGGREWPTFMGMPCHLNSNWEAIGAGDTTLTMSLINPEGVGWVERAGISIFVDPYGDRANGRVRFFPRVRFACINTQAAGIYHYTDHA